MLVIPLDFAKESHTMINVDCKPGTTRTNYSIFDTQTHNLNAKSFSFYYNEHDIFKEISICS